MEVVGALSFPQIVLVAGLGGGGGGCNRAVLSAAMKGWGLSREGGGPCCQVRASSGPSGRVGEVGSLGWPSRPGLLVLRPSFPWLESVCLPRLWNERKAAENKNGSRMVECPLQDSGYGGGVVYLVAKCHRLAPVATCP